MKREKRLTINREELIQSNIDLITFSITTINDVNKFMGYFLKSILEKEIKSSNIISSIKNISFNVKENEDDIITFIIDDDENSVIKVNVYIKDNDDCYEIEKGKLENEQNYNDAIRDNLVEIICDCVEFFIREIMLVIITIKEATKLVYNIVNTTVLLHNQFTMSTKFVEKIEFNGNILKIFLKSNKYHKFNIQIVFGTHEISYSEGLDKNFIISIEYLIRSMIDKSHFNI